MKLTVDTFRAWKNKRVTLLGMSGVGKTWLSSMLRRHEWFHYSADYRIGKRYLDEEILDLIKAQAMQVPFLRDLLRRDWIDIKNNIKIDDPGPVFFSSAAPAIRGSAASSCRNSPVARPSTGRARLPPCTTCRPSSTRRRRFTGIRISSMTWAAACASWTNPGLSNCWPSTR